MFLLREFAAQYPIQTKQIKTMAIPAMFPSVVLSVVEVVKSLRLFEGLTELVIVLGYTARPANEEGIAAPIFSPSGMWGEGSNSGREIWALPDDPNEALQSLKRESWPDWKIPTVSVTRYLEGVL